MVSSTHSNFASLVLDSGSGIDNAFFDSDDSDKNSENVLKERYNVEKISKNNGESVNDQTSKHESESSEKVVNYEEDFVELSPVRNYETKESTEMTEMTHISTVSSHISSFYPLKTFPRGPDGDNHVSKSESENFKGNKLKVKMEQKSLENLNHIFKILDLKKPLELKPKWCDPNSKRLPSDELAAISDLISLKTKKLSQIKEPHIQDLISENIRRTRSHTSINRRRELERIQQENFNIAKRLQSIRPTKELCRDEQIRSYLHLYNIYEPFDSFSHPSSSRVMTSRPSTSRTNKSSHGSSIELTKWKEILKHEYRVTPKNTYKSSVKSNRSTNNQEEKLNKVKVDYPVVIVPNLPPISPSEPSKANKK